ncbi:N-acetylmannosaminyltransferase [Cohnella kolymensis]|uniref:N-acetylglucosaminyldiphosphoundecaprenol N-acetyl-beta-D-mannosaminyltransferase n=2 Tax=Cohnella kolymensis TaxID=1590652 RepID=A0ABR5A6J3_9BACL|nr:N-acetylmannosaminyltransferase [Cohnella kolymensis]
MVNPNPRPYPTVSLYGVPFSRMDMKETVAYLTEAIESRRPHRVVTGNPIMLMAGLENPAFHRALATADLVVPDGSGVVWAARKVGQPVKERVAGFDLLHELLKEGEKRSWSVYLLGASAEIIDTAHAKLAEKYPGVRFVGHRDGYFSDREDGAVVSAVRAANPDLLFVARAMNNQEPWIAKYQEVLGVPVMMGVGGSFDVISGKLKRAPALFRKLGIEWFYRLLQEPSRFGRMLVLPRFAMKVLKDGEKVLKPTNP